MIGGSNERERERERERDMNTNILPFLRQII